MSRPDSLTTVVLTVITPSCLTAQHPDLNHPYTDGSTRAALVLDAKDVECLVARVTRDKKRIAFIDRAKIMDLDFAQGVPGG